MATETENQNQETSEVAEQQEQQPTSSVAGNVFHALDGLISKETLEGLKKVETPVVSEEIEEAQEEEQKEAPVVEKKQVAETKKDEQKSVLGIKKPGDKKQAEIVIENPDQILEVIKSKFGQEYKSINETPKFFETAQKWRSDSQSLEKVQKEHENMINLIEGLPPEFINGIKMYYNGQDYMPAFKDKAAFNFSLPVEKQDKTALVKHYFPGKFTDEDFSEEEPSDKLEIAIQAAQDKYNYTKQSLDSKRAEVEINATKRLEALKNSVSGSVNHLKQSFPDVEQDAVQDIASSLEGGIHKLAELFYNSDGTVKAEAAEMLLMAKHGKSEISKMMDIAANQAESRVNEELVTRGADSPKPLKSAKATQISDAVMSQIQELSALAGKRTY